MAVRPDFAWGAAAAAGPVTSDREEGARPPRRSRRPDYTCVVCQSIPLRPEMIWRRPDGAYVCAAHAGADALPAFLDGRPRGQGARD